MNNFQHFKNVFKEQLSELSKKTKLENNEEFLHCIFVTKKRRDGINTYLTKSGNYEALGENTLLQTKKTNTSLFQAIKKEQIKPQNNNFNVFYLCALSDLGDPVFLHRKNKSQKYYTRSGLLGAQKFSLAAAIKIIEKTQDKMILLPLPQKEAEKAEKMEASQLRKMLNYHLLQTIKDETEFYLGSNPEEKKLFLTENINEALHIHISEIEGMIAWANDKYKEDKCIFKKVS